MSAIIEILLRDCHGEKRLADIAANDAAAGIAASGPEMDQRFFERADLSQPTAEQSARANDRRALEQQIAAQHRAGWRAS